MEVKENGMGGEKKRIRTGKVKEDENEKRIEE
jgi:hypothetical protein